MKSEHGKVVSIHNPEIHKELYNISAKFNISMLQLRDTIDSILEHPSNKNPLPIDQDITRTPLEELNTAIIKNREIINKNLQSLNKD
ncbi:hypothetical protein ACQKL5_00675 [Peribacillus sp. NPDC097675]|uniref:hypothetical protein n=1 Tax=Peribacillus sp. NPDC097675 TaxID=3390618 RepID=UPI003D030D90